MVANLGITKAFPDRFRLVVPATNPVPGNSAAGHSPSEIPPTAADLMPLIRGELNIECRGLPDQDARKHDL